MNGQRDQDLLEMKLVEQEEIGQDLKLERLSSRSQYKELEDILNPQLKRGWASCFTCYIQFNALIEYCCGSKMT